MNQLIQLKKETPLFLIVLLLACFAIPQRAQAVSPAPDGGYPGGNTAEGQAALLSLTTGGFNTAVGFFSLRSNTTNSLNTAVGAGALLANAGDPALGQGQQNTATGAGALLSNTTGEQNTANGAFALFRNTTSGENTAVGDQALFSNTTGNGNTAIGDFALFSNTTGDGNTASGVGALFHNTTGVNNTASGGTALALNTTGAGNTAIGDTALINNTTGNLNMALGVEAGSNVISASSVICIGANVGGADVSNTTWIGNVYGVTTQNGTTAPVIVSADGQLGTVASSERFKKDIATMEKASETILSLRPVTFHYKSDIKSTAQFGLIAEEVAKVNPALVLPDKEGKPYTVRYEAVNAMLLNEFLKEHKAFIEEQRKVRELEANAAQQQKQIEALTAGLQKVSAQLEMSKPAPQTVLNNQ